MHMLFFNDAEDSYLRYLKIFEWRKVSVSSSSAPVENIYGQYGG